MVEMVRLCADAKVVYAGEVLLEIFLECVKSNIVQRRLDILPSKYKGKDLDRRSTAVTPAELRAVKST